MSVSHSEPLGRMLFFCAAVNVFFFLSTPLFYRPVLTANTHADIITEGPVSVIAPVGENALFHCNGSGFTIAWIVDGISHNDPTIVAQGISDITVSTSSGTIQSTLTVPAISVNNGIVIECRVISFVNGVAISNNATLTVLPGIGQVVNVRFTPSLSAVLWDPPATAGILSGLSYIVIVMNNNTGQVTVSATTNNTNYPLPILKPCQYYTANVTAFSSEHHSDSVVTGQRAPGALYDLKSVSQPPVVTSLNSTHCDVTFEIIIQQDGLLVCPDQKLDSVTYPTANTSDRTSHPEVAITQPGVMNYTALVRKGCHCLSDIMIVANDKIEMKTVPFSSYNVQDCDVSTDHTSILVECTFAINSTAPGIVVIQDDQSQYTINKTLQRLQQDSDKGSVNITGLLAGEYSVRVYDQEEDLLNNTNNTAYMSKLLQIVGFTHPSVEITYILPSSGSAHVVSVFSSTSSHVTPSMVYVHAHASIVDITVISVGATVVFVMASMLFLIVMTVLVMLYLHRKQA